MRLITSLRSCCHEIFKTDPIFNELREAQYKPVPYTALLHQIEQSKLFIDTPFNPDFPDIVRKFRSPVLQRVLAAMLYFFWKMDTVGFVTRYDGIINIRIIAIPAAFVRPSLIFIPIT